MLTIVLPTQNRPQYLARALSYYQRAGCPFPIVVCDSSDAARQPQVASLVAESRLRVRLHAFEHGIGIHEKLVRGVDGVDTEIMVFAADDDFIVPSSMRMCAEFLAARPEYSVAHGRAYTFVVRGAAVNGPITTIRPYRQIGSTRPSPAARLRAHFRDWTTTFYSVQRTRNVRDMLATFATLNDVTSCEVYYYATNAIRGMAARLECRYMFRQLDVEKQHISFDTHIWAASPEHQRVKDVLVREIAAELSRAEGMPQREAAAFVGSLLDGWVDARQPFALHRWRSYPPRYYWERTQNLGHKLGLRMREFRKPSPEGRVIKSVVEAHA